MQVFKAMFKIMSRLLPVAAMYLVLFTIISLILDFQGDTAVDFTQKKVNVAVVNEDGGEIGAALTAYLAETNNLVELGEGENAVDDALFFRSVEYIVTVPAGFTERFFTEAPLTLGRSVVPDSMDEVYVTLQLNRFLNTVRAYGSHTALPLAEVLRRTGEDLASADVEVTMRVPEGAADFSAPSIYFNWQVYTLLAVLGFSITMMMGVFRDRAVRMRTACAALPARKIALQQYLFYGLFALAVMLVEIAVAMIAYGSAIFTVNGGFAILNYLALTLVYLSMCFMFGTFNIASVGINALVNVLGLGMSFLSGVFVPQYLLADGVLVAARFLPTYWYVTNNNLLADATTFGPAITGQLLGNLAVMLAFAVLFVLIALLINKRKQKVA